MDFCSADLRNLNILHVVLTFVIRSEFTRPREIPILLKILQPFTMKNSFIALAITLICFASAAIASGPPRTYSGVIFQNSWANRINLTDPQDSNMIVTQFVGTPNNGWIYLNVSGPSTYCPDGPTSCGRYVQDISVIIRSDRKRLSLHSMVNNPNPLVGGTASLFYVAGYWTNDGVRFTISYNIDLVRTGIWSKVPILAVYAGSVTKEYVPWTFERINIFRGTQWGFVIPYVSLRYGGVNPYQYLATYGEMDSSQPFSKLAGFRVYSPAGTATDPLYPATQNGVFGTISNTVFNGGKLHGFISMSTPVGSHVNVTNLPFESDYEFLDESLGYLRINLGLARESAQVQYLLQGMNLIVTEEDS